MIQITTDVLIRNNGGQKTKMQHLKSIGKKEQKNATVNLEFYPMRILFKLKDNYAPKNDYQLKSSCSIHPVLLLLLPPVCTHTQSKPTHLPILFQTFGQVFNVIYLCPCFHSLSLHSSISL